MPKFTHLFLQTLDKVINDYQSGPVSIITHNNPTILGDFKFLLPFRGSFYSDA